MKALVVEDDLVLSFLYETYLNRLGFETEGNMVYGKTAVETAQNFNPNLILMDIILEGEMDGIDAVKKIQDEKDIPVIYITSSTDPNHKRRAAQATKYLEYLTKPIDFDDLKEVIKKHFDIKS
jgi:DNA-binding response OmpR family regulator